MNIEDDDALNDHKEVVKFGSLPELVGAIVVIAVVAYMFAAAL